MKKHSIFISSAQKELAEERHAIRDFVRGDPLLRRFFDVWLFEDQPATDRRADDLYLAQVALCDIYIGLYGRQYGAEDAQGLSPTEREFDHASAKGKPRLVFVKGADDKDRQPKMAALIRKAGTQLIRRRFAGVADLTTAVYASLVEHLERTGDLRTKPFDAAVCPDATLADISRERLTEFLSVAKTERGYALGPKTSTPKALAHLNLLDGDRPSHAAVLLFGKKPQRFLMTSEVKCMHFHGTEVQKPIPSYHIYKGTLFELVDQASDFVMSKIDRAVIPQSNAVKSLIQYEIPYEAVREAIVNAVTHRDYTSNASVQVMLFADRLEVWNPGELPPTLTLEKLRKPHASIPHNPLIAEPMFLATYAEKAGSGILDMLARCHKAGLRGVEFREDGGQFVQTLWRPRPIPTPQVTPQVGTQSPTQSTTQSPAQSDDPVTKLLVALNSGSRSPLALRQAIGLTHRHTFRTNYLHPALKAALIEPTIPGKPSSRLQKYRLTDKGRAWMASAKP